MVWVYFREKQLNPFVKSICSGFPLVKGGKTSSLYYARIGMIPHEIQQYQCLKGVFPFSTVTTKCNCYISQLSNLLDT